MEPKLQYKNSESVINHIYYFIDQYLHEGHLNKVIIPQNELNTKSLEFKQIIEKFLVYTKPPYYSQSHYDNNTRYINRFILTHLGNLKLSEITLDHIQNYLEFVRDSPKLTRKNCGKKRSPSTLNKHIFLLSKIFAFAKKNNFIRSNVMNFVPIYKEVDNSKKIDFLNLKEGNKFLTNCSKKFYPIAKTFLLTGMRCGELVSLRWEDIDYENDYICISRSYDKSTKNNSARIIPLHKELKLLFFEHKSLNSKSDLVFPNKYGKMRCNINPFRSQIVNGLERASIIKKTSGTHLFRHTFAVWFLTSGGSLEMLKHLMGHKDFKTTLRYSHLSKQNDYIKNQINNIKIDF